MNNGGSEYTDLLTALGISGLTPFDTNGVNDGYSSVPIATIKIAGVEYLLKDVLTVFKNALVAQVEKTGVGIHSGLEVAQQSVPNMTFKVSAGVRYLADGTRQAVAAITSKAVDAADTVKDRVDLVYLNADGVVTYLAGGTEVDAVAGARSYTVTLNAVEDDTITIDGEVFTAIRTTPAAGEFTIGSTIPLTATALYTLIGLNATLAALYTITNPSDGVVTLTETAVGGGNTPGAATKTGTVAITNGTATQSVAAVEAVAGARGYTVTVNAVEDDTVDIDGETFTAIRTTPTASIAGARTYTVTDRAELADTVTIGGETLTCVNGEPGTDEFAEAATVALTATSLATAITANTALSALYTVTNPSAGVIVLTETVPGGGNTPGVATKSGTIAITSGTATTSTPTDEFNIGVSTTATATTLYSLFGLNTVLKARYTITNPSAGVVTLTETTPGGGDTPSEATKTGTVVITNGSPTNSAAAVLAIAGARTYTVTDRAELADTVVIGAQTFTCVNGTPGAGEFEESGTIAGCATNLAAVIAANATLDALYAVTNPSAGVIVLTEKVPGAGDTPGEATKTGTIAITNGTATTSAAAVDAVAGARSYTVATNAAHKDTITIDGETFTAIKAAAGTDEFVPGATIALTATALYNLVNANAVLSVIYTATNPSDGVILITETSAGGLDTPGEAAVTGTVDITNGDATESVAYAAGGTVPATPSGGIALAELDVDADQETVTTSDITKKRVWTSPGVND
jgi:hypothetical protein